MAYFGSGAFAGAYGSGAFAAAPAAALGAYGAGAFAPSTKLPSITLSGSGDQKRIGQFPRSGEICPKNH
jgi:hypothetical protein